MLQLLRHKHVSKIIFWSLLILILPAFVLWGTGNIGGSKNKGPSFVGKIDDKKVSFGDLASSIMSIRSQIILNYFNQPDALNALLKSKPFLARLAWDRIIMLSEAKKSHIKVADKEVINTIKSHPIFNRGGGFDDKLYEYILRYNLGLSPRSFEETIRQSVSIQKLNDMLTKDIKVDDADIAAQYMRENGKYKISYVLFDLKEKLDKVNVTDDMVKDYYEKNKANIAVTPKSEGDKTAPARPATFDEARADIKNFLTEGEARRLSFNDSADVYKKISETMEKDKLSFEDAAAKLGLKMSQTDFISRTDKVEEIGEAPVLAEALMVLKVGEMSKPIPSRNGVIIIKIVETAKMDEEKFKAAKDEYAKKALEVKKNRYLEDWLRGLEVKTVLNIDFNDYDKYYQ
jgi:peptidyl-prolyl cis-trans isomerase D